MSWSNNNSNNLILPVLILSILWADSSIFSAASSCLKVSPSIEKHLTWQFIKCKMWLCHHYKHLTLRRSIKANSKWVWHSSPAPPAFKGKCKDLQSNVLHIQLTDLNSPETCTNLTASGVFHNLWLQIRALPYKNVPQKIPRCTKKILQNPSSIYTGHLTASRSTNRGKTHIYCETVEVKAT